MLPATLFLPSLLGLLGRGQTFQRFLLPSLLELLERGARDEGFRDSMPESLSLQKFHDDEGLSFVLADFVDGADVGMIQSGSGPRLALEPLQGHSIGGQSLGLELQGDVAPQSQVLGSVATPMPPPPSFSRIR